jgi:large subunit ribosomal protein L18
MKKKSANEKTRKWSARRGRVRIGLGASKRTRLTVFRSAKHIYAQLIDPEGKTLAAVSTRSKDMAGGGGATGNIEAAKRVGTEIARKAKEQQIDQVVFNRNGFLFHGRVKALAEAAREAGLSF